VTSSVGKFLAVLAQVPDPERQPLDGTSWPSFYWKGG